MKLIVTDPALVVVAVNIFPSWLVTFIVSQSLGNTLVPPAAQATHSVNVTGVKFGKLEKSSPPSGASMIHSIELPLNFAGDGFPGAAGGANVMLKCELLVLFVMMIFPAVWF